jgi:hypothetical protein
MADGMIRESKDRGRTIRGQTSPAHSGERVRPDLLCVPRGRPYGAGLLKRFAGCRRKFGERCYAWWAY